MVSWLLFVVLCSGVGITLCGNPATTEDFRIGGAGRAEALPDGVAATAEIVAGGASTRVRRWPNASSPACAARPPSR
jgi:hypothetical protein